MNAILTTNNGVIWPSVTRYLRNFQNNQFLSRDNNLITEISTTPSEINS